MNRALESFLLQKESTQTQPFPMHAFYDILYVFSSICVFCNLDFFFFLDVIKLCKVKYRHRLGYFCIMK